jgi:hypothetical protein
MRIGSVVTSVAGAIAVGIVGVGLGVPPILGACLLGIVVGALPHLVRRVTPAQMAPLFVGGFVGMTSPVVLLGPEWLLLAGVLTGLLWSVVRDAWIGVGGKMGVVAFTGTGLATVVAILMGNGGMAAPVDMFAAWDLPLMGAIAVIAVALTHLLAYRLRWGPVLASGVTTTAFLLLLLPLQSAMVGPSIALGATWLGASFVGMTAPVHLRGKRWPLVGMALTFTVLLSLFQDTISGLGGDVGATAASAVIAVIGAQWALGAAMSRIRPSRRPHP